MSRGESQKVLLVNYAGYVLCANTFVPDNSLGTLAAALKLRGFAVEVVDLQGAASIGSVMDHAEVEAAQILCEAIGSGETPTDALVHWYHAQREQGLRWLAEATARVLLQKVAEENVGLIGFKLWAKDSVTIVIRMAEAIRAAYPHVLLLAGGPAVQYCQNHLLKLTQVFDDLVLGEGEYAIVAWASRMMSGGLHAS